MLKIIGYVLLSALVVIQFFHPKQNKAEGPFPNHLGSKLVINEEVKAIFKNSCYDCHSNNTNYPWYSNLQPVAWYLADHVNDGKQHFNFDEFASYSLKKQKHKLEEMAEEVKKGEMPLESYTLIHRSSILKPEEKQAIQDWVTTSIQALDKAADGSQQ
jgi:hypothetical protein